MDLESIHESSVEEDLVTLGESSYYSIKLVESNFDQPVNEFIKSLEWLDHDQRQTYDGRVLNASLHGEGKYVWGKHLYRPLPEFVAAAAYEGTFYANFKEGYGLLSYADGSTFEGLFKDGHPFGPGVFTASDGHQNVGLWRGSKLYRTYAPIEGVPKLADSTPARIKIMKYRRLVPSFEEDSHGVVKDFTRLVLVQMDAPEKVANNCYSKLFNPDARSPRSLFFNQYSHDKKYFNEPDSEEEASAQEVEIEELSEIESMPKSLTESMPTSLTESMPKSQSMPQSMSKPTSWSTASRSVGGQVITSESVQKVAQGPVTKLVAWNNEPFMMDVLTHVYKNQPLEANLTFPIATLVTGQRKCWRSRGEQEEIVWTYLNAAVEGDRDQLRRLITFFVIDENVSDARGNNAILCAAAGDHHDAMRLLAHEGARVNHMNDEGLTPLNLCIARYLAVKNRVTRWELAFLPPESECSQVPSSADNERVEWNLRKSKTNVNLMADEEIDDDEAAEIFRQQLAKAGGKVPEDLVVPVRKYLLSLRPLLVLPEKPESDKKGKKGKKEKKTDGEGKSKKDKKSKKEKEGKKDKEGKKTDAGTEADGEKEAPKKKKKSKEPKEEVAEEIVDPNALTEEETSQLSQIEATIDLLLELGADPNAGQTPVTPLVFSLFTNNLPLTEKLLARGACAKSPTVGFGFNLTPLHVVALMKPVEEAAPLVKLLTAYGAQAHAEADLDFDQETQQLLRTGLDAELDSEVVDTHGLIPLQALVLRPDIRHSPDTLLNIKNLLRELAAQCGPLCKHRYFGHSPLSLAVFRGHMDILTELLSLNQFDPDEELGSGLGNTLAVLAALRSFDLVPVADRLKMCDLLVAYGADPLMQIALSDAGFRGNVVDFYVAQVKSETGKQPNPKHLAKEFVAKLKEYKKLTASLMEKVKDRMVRHVVGRLTLALADAVKKALSYSSEEHLEASAQVKSLANLLTESELVSCIVMQREAKQLTLTAAQASAMLDAVAAQNQQRAQFAGPDNAELLAYLSPVLGETEGVATTSYTRQSTPFFVRPELASDASRFAVCFECGRADVATLETCPRCGLVSFCSKACNKGNVAHKGANMHRCGNAFFGVKDLAAVANAPVWTQLWKKGGKGGKKKEKKAKEGKKKEKKVVGSGLGAKADFLRGLGFDDGVDYDAMGVEKAEGDRSAAEVAELPPDVAGDDVAGDALAVTVGGELEAAPETEVKSVFLNSAANLSRRSHVMSDEYQVTKNLRQVRLRLSKHSSLADFQSPLKKSQKKSAIAAKKLFSCSSESYGDKSHNVQEASAKVEKTSGILSQAIHEDGAKVKANDGRSDSSAESSAAPNVAAGQPEATGKENLFLQTTVALGSLELGVKGNLFAGETAAPASTEPKKGGLKTTDKHKRRQNLLRSDSKTRFQPAGQPINAAFVGPPKMTNAVNKPAGKYGADAVCKNGKLFLCRMQPGDSRCQDKMADTRPGQFEEYFPAQAICSLLKYGAQGGPALNPDMFFLPYTIYKNGDLFYWGQTVPPSCENSSLV